MIEIYTPRLHLRTPVLEDAPAIANAIKPVWGELQKWMSWAHDGADTEESVRENLIKDAVESNALTGFCHETGKFVICTGIHPMQGTPNEYMTGYWIAHDFLGRGLAAESTNAIVRYAFNVLGAKKIHISFFDGNDKSKRIAKKLGFIKAGVRKNAATRCLDGTLLDKHDYIMTSPAGLPPLPVTWETA